MSVGDFAAAAAVPSSSNARRTYDRVSCRKVSTGLLAAGAARRRPRACAGNVGQFHLLPTSHRGRRGLRVDCFQLVNDRVRNNKTYTLLPSIAEIQSTLSMRVARTARRRSDDRRVLISLSVPSALYKLGGAAPLSLMTYAPRGMSRPRSQETMLSSSMFQ